MSATRRPDTVLFTAKGQIVIPASMRKAYQIGAGTRAVVQATPEGILLKPVTAALIRRGRGIIKRKAGEKPMAEWWADFKKEEMELEERRHGRRRSR